MSEEKTKKELFDENPERFEDLEKVAMVIKKNEEGRWMAFINPMSEADAYFIRGFAEDKIREYQAVM